MLPAATITLVQFEDHRDGAEAVARMPPYFAQAKDAGADLIVFPEYILGRRIAADHPNVLAFRDLARRHGIYAIAGLIENHGTKWSTTALMVDRGGTVLGRYLKTHPAAGPGPHWWPPVPGDDDEARGLLGHEFPIFHLDFGAVGILQCYDGYFPEAWAACAYAGAEVICWINGRAGFVQDAYCIAPAHAHGVVVAGCITNGYNTGFAAPKVDCLRADGTPEESRLFPRRRELGDGAVTARLDLAKLRHHRKHLRTMHQRRPELYGALTRDVKLWQRYPEIPWDRPECEQLVNRAQLP